MIPNTSNIYLRYFTTTDEGKEIDEVFIPISDLDYSGVPIDSDGNNKDSDGYLYYFNGNNYCQLMTIPLQ